MTAQEFINELAQEAVATKRLLERLPEDELSWKPHPKSMSLGQLAMHLAILPRAITELITNTVVEAPIVPRPEAKSVAEVMTTLDASVAFATEQLAAWGDLGLAVTWKLTSRGNTLFEMPRGAVFRTIMLNHWYHHRGQMTVYLRLRDVPLPSIYGPTADEKPFG